MTASVFVQEKYVFSPIVSILFWTVCHCIFQYASACIPNALGADIEREFLFHVQFHCSSGLFSAHIRLVQRFAYFFFCGFKFLVCGAREIVPSYATHFSLCKTLLSLSVAMEERYAQMIYCSPSICLALQTWIFSKYFHPLTLYLILC